MKLIEHIYGLLAPYDCLVCGAEGELICNWCRDDALPPVIERCYRCNALSEFSRTCPSCRRNSPISQVWTRTEYTERAKEIIHKMKFKYSGHAADLIGRELANTIPALPDGTLIVHVPTATNHVRERGFDHTKRIARQLSVESGLRHLPLLTRVTKTRQVGSKRGQRLMQMKDAFRTRFDEEINGAQILLVDDVLTTGATLEAAAATLKSKGAKRVDAVIFARAN